MFRNIPGVDLEIVDILQADRLICKPYKLLLTLLNLFDHAWKSLLLRLYLLLTPFA